MYVIKIFLIQTSFNAQIWGYLWHSLEPQIAVELFYIDNFALGESRNILPSLLPFSPFLPLFVSPSLSPLVQQYHPRADQ